MGSGTPTFGLGRSFLEYPQRFDATYQIVGIPWDLGTSNRAGARFGPSAIRAASRMLVDGEHPVHWVDPKKLNAADLGDFAIVQGDIEATMEEITAQALEQNHLICMGGDHSVSLALLRALSQQYEHLGVIHLDAHVDTWSDNFGGVPYGHGNPFYHAINDGLIDPQRMVQIGLRSPVQKSVYDWTVAQGVTIVPAMEFHAQGPRKVAETVAQIMDHDAVYLTIDIDVLDPAFAPGTGTPEIGGLATWQVQEFLRCLRDVWFVGMDLVEVAPPYDVSEITALAGATFMWEYLSILLHQGGDKTP